MSSRGPFAGRAVINAKDNCSPVDNNPFFRLCPKLDMRCRNSGCKNKSKGPRFRFLCEKHLKLPRAEQNAALARLARRRMVGFDGRGRSLRRGSRLRPRTLMRAHPLFVSSGGSS